MKLKKLKFPLAFAISLSFTIVLMLTGGMIGAFNFIGMKQILLTSTQEVIKRSGETTISELLRIYEPVQGFVKVLSKHPITTSLSTSERLQFLPFLKEGLDTEPAMSAVYIGYEDGSFFLMRNLTPNYKPQFAIPEGSKYLVQTIEIGKTKNVLFYFFNEALEEVGTHIPENYEYDPRSRDWYLKANEEGTVVRTDPYVFFTTKEVGKTFAIRNRDGKSVIGADVTLSAISSSLVSKKLTPSTQIVLIDSKKNALAYLNPEKLVLKTEDDKIKLAHLDQMGVEVLNKIGNRYTPGQSQTSFLVEVSVNTWMAYSSPVSIEGEENNYLIITAPEDELLSEAQASLNNTILITSLLILLTVPFIFFITSRISHSMKSMSELARAIRDFDFSGGLPKASKIKELHELGNTIGTMKTTIQNFLGISSLLTSEKNFDKLLQRILYETVSASGTEAGILYLVSEDEDFLLPGAVYSRDGREIKPDEVANVSLKQKSDSYPLLDIIQKDKTGVLQLDSRAFQSELKFLGDEGLAKFPFLLGVPLKNQGKELIGFLCLFERYDISNSKAIISFVENLSGTSSVAIENQRLLDAQKKLFESFIQLIASAIDTKSPYTGGHCSRVPEIATMLANAAIKSGSGSIANFTLDEKGREALHIGAWLHDCGKIVTPEYVVDKATKLETIYDRLHEIRMRFELIKSNLKVSYYKNLLDGGDKESLSRELDAELKQVDDDYLFIASCNEGGEFMAPEKIERVKKIATRTWERTLDDTIGLSHEEKTKRKNANHKLPCVENLLSDKVEHIIERQESDKISPDNPWKFKVNVPKYKFNRGEIYNLCIARGTLTEEERFIINAHMIQTIKMLEELPFPKHLRNVPEIAGGHHEKMDGTGYPRRLSKGDMSIPARIMAIADIFEALTAVDRPYKKGKTLSETIKIMNSMQKENHIDPELFEIFLKEKVYLDYAKKYMQPYQIDEVNISQYVTV